MEIVVALTKKGKVVHLKQVWIGENRIKAATCYCEISFSKNFPQQQQLASSSYQRTQPLVKFLNNTCLRSDFSAQPLSKLNNFYLCRIPCTTTINPYSRFMMLQSLQFILFCVRKMILYQIVVRMSERLFLLMTLYTSLTRRTWCLMYILIVVLRSSLKLLQKWDRSTENGITFPDPVKNPNAFPATINIPVLLMSSIALISFWTRTINGTWFQQLLCHSTTLMIHTLCSISTLNQQLNNQKQTQIRCSLHCEGMYRLADWSWSALSFDALETSFCRYIFAT